MEPQKGRYTKQLAQVLLGAAVVGGLVNPEPICLDGTETKHLLSAGTFHTCAASGTLLSDATSVYTREIKCWGWHEFGQTLPPRTENLGSVVKGLSCGARHSCGVSQNGSVVCWGSNMYGQLDVSRPLAEPVCKYCDRGDYVSDERLRAIGQCEDNGLLEYWIGDPVCKTECLLEDRAGVLVGFVRSNGQISDERTVPVYRSDGRFVCTAAQTTCGGHHTCVLYGNFSCTNCNTGYVKCYGSNMFGQIEVPECSDGKPASFRDEVLVCTDNSPPYVWSQVSAGLFHTCAVTTDGYIKCWGDNKNGQSEEPVGRFLYVSAGAYHSCGISIAGKVQCWGNNSYGQALNHEELVDQQIVEAGGIFTEVACGASHTCGVFVPSGNTIYGSTGEAGTKSDPGGMVVCWGADYAGQSTPPEAALSYMVSVTVGWEHSCGVSLDDHSVVCWGGTTSASKGLLEPTVQQGNCISVCAECITAPGPAPPAPPTLAVACVASLISLAFSVPSFFVY